MEAVFGFLALVILIGAEFFFYDQIRKSVDKVGWMWMTIYSLTSLVVMLLSACKSVCRKGDSLSYK